MRVTVTATATLVLRFGANRLLPATSVGLRGNPSDVRALQAMLRRICAVKQEAPPMDSEMRQVLLDSTQQEYPSAKLLLEPFWREFDTDVDRHRSLIARATTLLTVCISMLTLVITGLSLAPTPMPIHGLPETIVGLLILISLVVAGAYSTWAVSASQRPAPNIEDLRLPKRYMGREDEATVTVAEGYADCVEERRKITDIIAWRVNMAARSLFVGLFFTAVLAGLVLVGKGVQT